MGLDNVSILHRRHTQFTHAKKQGALGVTWKKNLSASLRFTSRTSSVSVIQRFGAGDAEAGQRAAVVHRD